jgi:hypothetical protein
MSNDEPQRRLLKMRFSVDTNCVNARQAIPAMNQLEIWAELELIELLTSFTAQNEMAYGNNVQRKRKAYNFIFTKTVITTEEDRHRFKTIENVLFPNGANSQNEVNDVDIVFNSVNHVTKLITNDGGSKKQPGGILGNRTALSSIGAIVLTPEEAHAEVVNAIQERDLYAKQWASFYNKPLPDWVGQD